MEYVTTALSYFHDDHSHPYLALYSFTMLVHFAHSLSGCYFNRLALENYPHLSLNTAKYYI